MEENALVCNANHWYGPVMGSGKIFRYHPCTLFDLHGGSTVK